jgi:hypothetical protein
MGNIKIQTEIREKKKKKKKKNPQNPCFFFEKMGKI